MTIVLDHLGAAVGPKLSAAGAFQTNAVKRVVMQGALRHSALELCTGALDMYMMPPNSSADRTQKEGAEPAGGNDVPQLTWNHAGSSRRVLAERAKWRADIASLAASCPNVVCKVGGVQMVLNGWGWEERRRPISSAEIADATWPWYSHAIACFGASRCMFESNFPVP